MYANITIFNVNVVYHFAPVGGGFACAGIPCLSAENDAFDVNCGKMKGRIDLDILDSLVWFCRGLTSQ